MTTALIFEIAHGNEIEVERIGGTLTMFIPTMASGSEKGNIITGSILASKSQNPCI